MTSGPPPLPHIPLKRTNRDLDEIRRRLASWLAAQLGANGTVHISAMEAPLGGVANETLLFDATWTAAGREQNAGFVARLAADDPLFIEADIERHAQAYRALASVPGVPVPRIVGFEADPDVLGTAFFVMERVVGDVPRDIPKSWHEQGFIFEASPARRRTMWESAVGVMAALHRADLDRFSFLAPPPGVSGLAADLAYWRRFLDHGSAGEPIDAMEAAYEWLVAHLPADQPTGLAWGDAKFPNLMFRNDRVVALLDMDQMSLAGPETDLAWLRLAEAGAAPLDGIGDGDELVRVWEELSGRRVRDMEWHDMYAIFKSGVTRVVLFRNLALEGALAPDVARFHGRDGNARALLLAERMRALGD